VGKRVVIVGNGMASHRFCEQLTERGREAPPLQLVVIGEERRPAYDRVNLTRLLFGETPEALELDPCGWYEARGIELVTGDAVVAVDTAARRVETQRGRQLRYDLLVFATGSRAFIPPIPGVELPRVFPYRSADDLLAIRAAALEGQRAAVLGGGLLGLEAARSLADLGLATTVLEVGPSLLGRQLDPRCAEVLLERVVVSGIDARVATRVRSILPEGNSLVLELEDGTSLAVDLVVVAAGVRPRDEVAAAAGIERAPQGGIAIDDGLQTSAPHVYAIGECAAFRGQTHGFAAPGYAMADALARRLRGDEASRYRPALQSCELKGAGVEAATVGEFPSEAERRVHVHDGGIRMLALRDGRVVGASTVGTWMGFSMAREAIASGTKMSARAQLRFASRGELPGSLRLPVAAWPAERLVCNCVRVNRGQLSLALSQGASCPRDLMQATGAGALCGSCEPLLEELCGSETGPARRGRWVLLTSALAMGLAVGIVGARPLGFATTMSDAWREVDALWRVGWIKQTTGFVLLGLALLATSIAARKRIEWFSWGRFPTHRALHTAIGTFAIVMTVAHTGLRFGHNLNFALMALFVGLCVLGGATGIVAHLEGGTDKTGSVARWWRPWIARAHLLATWPMAVLLGFHVFSAYYF